MYIDSTLQPIADNAPYTAPDGTQYPWNWDKSTIPGLQPVTLTSAPTDPTLQVTGFIIDGTYTQVWQTVTAPDSVAINAMNQAATNALAKSDDTMLRVQEAISLGLTTWLTADVVAWVNYRRELRPLIKSSVLQLLPTKPTYPVGS